MSLLLGGSYDRASVQVVGPSEDAAGALLYGGDGLIREKVLLDVYAFEVMQEVDLHVLEGDAGQMASGPTTLEARGREILYIWCATRPGFEA
ncbi:hypothetical protein DFAR_3460005 [Desulfarculales bacterium]